MSGRRRGRRVGNKEERVVREETGGEKLGSETILLRRSMFRLSLLFQGQVARAERTPQYIAGSR